MSQSLSILLPLALFSLACVGAGSLALRALPRRPLDAAPTESVLAFLLGQGILGSALHVPALLGGFSLSVLMPVTALLGCWGLRHFYVNGARHLAAMREAGVALQRAPLLWKLIAAGVVFILIAGAASVAGIVTADAQAFYLALPKVVAASQRLVPLPGYEGFTSVGLLPEMQLAALFLFGMPGASPRLFCWLTALAGAVVLLAIGRHAELGRRGQIISIAVFATSSAVSLLWGQGKTDFFAASYGLAASLFALRSWESATRVSAIALTGLFTGFALVAKLSYIVAFLPSIGILLMWREFPRLVQAIRDRKHGIPLLTRYAREGLVFGRMLLVAFLPHVAKNLILLDVVINTYGPHQYFSADTVRRIVLNYPLVLIFGGYWAQYGNMSVLLLAFLPLPLVVHSLFSQRSEGVTAVTVAAAAGLLAWVAIFPGVPMPRYFLATLLLLAIPAGWAAEGFSRLGRIAHASVCLATLLVMLFFYQAGRLEVFVLRDAYHYVFPSQADRKLIPGDVGHEAYEVLNAVAEPGARVFLFSYFRFWLRPDLIQTTNTERKGDNVIAFDRRNPEKIWHNLHAHGFTYLLMDPTTSPDLDPMSSVPPWVRVETLYKQDNWQVYRLTFVNQPVKPRLSTREVASGAWDVVPAGQVQVPAAN